jgi:hypothetical protein
VTPEFHNLYSPISTNSGYCQALSNTVTRLQYTSWALIVNPQEQAQKLKPVLCSPVFHSPLKFWLVMQIKLRDWWVLKKILKQRYPQLSEEDLDFSYGKEQELILRLQQKTGKSQEEVIRIIKSIQVAYLQHALL